MIKLCKTKLKQRPKAEKGELFGISFHRVYLNDDSPGSAPIYKIGEVYEVSDNSNAVHRGIDGELCVLLRRYFTLNDNGYASYKNYGRQILMLTGSKKGRVLHTQSTLRQANSLRAAVWRSILAEQEKSNEDE